MKEASRLISRTEQGYIGDVAQQNTPSAFEQSTKRLLYGNSSPVSVGHKAGSAAYVGATSRVREKP